jgi:hypothetical protein
MVQLGMPDLQGSSLWPRLQTIDQRIVIARETVEDFIGIGKKEVLTTNTPPIYGSSQGRR